MCKVESPQGNGYGHCEPRPGRRFPWIWPAAILALAAVLLASVLAWPNPAPAPAVAGPAAVQVEATTLPASPPSVGQKEVLAALLRHGVRPEGLSSADFPMVDVLLATPLYFSFSGRQMPEALEGQPSILFYVSEEVHVGELPSRPPRPFLRMGGVYRNPTEVKMLTDSPHHRTTMVRYQAAPSDGRPILTPETRSLEMVFPATSGVEIYGSVLSWELPISYGPTYSSQEVALGGFQTNPANASDSHDGHLAGSHEHSLNLADLTQLGGSPLTLLTIPVILGVVLAALTPCLVDLSLYYGAYLGGAGAAAGAGVSLVRSSLVKSALFFILGFTIVYTAGGAAAGQAGQILQRFGLVIEWSRPISIIGGVVVILVALRMAAQLRAPLVCRLPMLSPARVRGSGPWRSALMGSTFAAQCFSCFSGTIISALILYAAVSGSPLTGALTMLAFSLGLGVVLLLGTLLMTSFVPITFGLKRIRPYLGLASALFMLGFGVTMILDKEHIFSDFVVRLFGAS